MIDIHSHIIYEVDDGASTMKESINIIKKLNDLGFDSIIATPHYIENTKYNNTLISNEKKLDLIRKKAIEEKINIKLYLGNEIFISDNIIKNIENKNINSMCYGKYLLIELPINNKMASGLDMMLSLKTKGWNIILAHPERYTLFQKDFKMLDEIIESGILLQGNFGSLIGMYGNKAKNLYKKLLKQRKYFVLASDVHKDNSILFRKFAKIKSKTIKICGEKYFNDLTYNNPLDVIESKK